MQVPLITIVLPTYNGSRYLAQSIESCLAQTMANWELIIVDDASTDQTPQIIADYVSRDPRIRSLRNPTNCKTPRSLNAGFEASRGSLLTWTSDDNLFRPTALEEMVGVLQNRPDVDFVYTALTIIDEFGTEGERREALPPEQLLMVNVVNACFLYRREVHEALGGYADDMFLVEDYDFWLRASARFRLLALNKDLYLFRWHRQSQTQRRRAECALAHERVVAKHLPSLGWASPEQRATAYHDLARRAEVRGDHAERRRYLECAQAACPASGINDRMSFDDTQHWGWLALGNGQVSAARKYAFHSFIRRPWSTMGWRLGYCSLRGR